MRLLAMPVLFGLATLAPPDRLPATLPTSPFLCFQHIGEQDKPLPGFCVVSPGHRCGDPDAQQLAAPFVAELVQEAETRSSSLDASGTNAFGTYLVQTAAFPNGRILEPGSMKSLLRRIVVRLRSGGQAPIEAIANTAHRLQVDP